MNQQVLLTVCLLYTDVLARSIRVSIHAEQRKQQAVVAEFESLGAASCADWCVQLAGVCSSAIYETDRSVCTLQAPRRAPSEPQTLLQTPSSRGGSTSRLPQDCAQEPKTGFYGRLCQAVMTESAHELAMAGLK